MKRGCFFRANNEMLQGVSTKIFSAGYLYSEHGHHWLGLFCSACCAAAFVFSFVGLRIHPNKAIHDKTE
jgi:hypothetical protein